MPTNTIVIKLIRISLIIYQGQTESFDTIVTVKLKVTLKNHALSLPASMTHTRKYGENNKLSTRHSLQSSAGVRTRSESERESGLGCLLDRSTCRVDEVRKRAARSELSHLVRVDAARMHGGV